MLRSLSRAIPSRRRACAQRNRKLLFERFESRRLLAGVWDGGGAIDDWNDPLNWDNDAVPASGANVVIGAAFAASTITSANPVALGSITSAASLSITAGTFSIA